MQHAFFVHFFAVVLHNYKVKLPSCTFYGGNVVCVPVHSFSLPLIFTLVAASISHFLTGAIKFSCYSSNKIGLLCFLSLALALSLLSTSMWTLKLSRKKELSLLLLLFFISKSPSGYAIYRRNARVLEMQNFTPLTWAGGRTYGRVRTIFSEPKFLGCIDNQIPLPMVLRYK